MRQTWSRAAGDEDGGFVPANVRGRSIGGEREDLTIVTDANDERLRLADRLRAARLRAGLSGKDLSRLSGWQPSKVSRLETGRQLPSELDVLRWGKICGSDVVERDELLALREAVTSAHRAWRLRARHGVRAVQTDHDRLVARSTTVRDFETAWVPCLLQTPDYARHVFAEMVALHQVAVASAEAAVTLRIERQRHLYDLNKRFEFLVTEPVLRWGLCPPGVMLAQLDRLRGVVGLTHIRFGVLPLDAVIATPPQNSFQLYDGTAIIQTFIGETAHGPGESAGYAQVLDRLWRDAATGADTLALLDAATARLRPRGRAASVG